ncbi:Uncharacterised protein [Pseudomonas putida]|nr:Uncharacterised protein [Pseudomonas putida]CAB5658109.1 Uncharacterised protein [Pseudomonas putida]
MLDPQHRGTRLAPGREQLLEHLDTGFVQGRHGFVEYQQLRFGDQPLGQQHALAFAPGEGAHAPFAFLEHADPRQGRVDGWPHATGQAQEGRATLAQGGHEIVHGHRQAPVELQSLGHVADHFALGRPVQGHLALVRHLPKQCLDQRTLAAAIGADDGMHAAGGDAEGHVFENARTPQGQVDAGELDARPAGGAEVGGCGHVRVSWMARTTVSRLRFISTSYLSWVYSP